MAFEGEEALADRSIPDVNVSVASTDRQPPAIRTPSHPVRPPQFSRGCQYPKQLATVRVEQFHAIGRFVPDRQLLTIRTEQKPIRIYSGCEREICFARARVAQDNLTVPVAGG